MPASTWTGPRPEQTALQKKRKAKSTHNGKVRRLPNGLLDVTRKGKYLNLIRTNSSTPLLQLPAEIRNRIFAYALGGRSFQVLGNQVKCYSKYPNPESLSLLRTCRQIYSETALLPFSANIFRVTNEQSPGDLESWLQLRLPVERESITMLHCRMGSPEPLQFLRRFLSAWKLKPTDLPNLKRVHVDISGWPRLLDERGTAHGNIPEDAMEELERHFDALYPGVEVSVANWYDLFLVR